jgi:hypothetical protein
MNPRDIIDAFMEVETSREIGDEESPHAVVDFRIGLASGAALLLDGIRAAAGGADRVVLDWSGDDVVLHGLEQVGWQKRKNGALLSFDPRYPERQIFDDEPVWRAVPVTPSEAP